MNASNSADRAARAALQGELRDLLCLAVVGEHLRWVVRGDGGELGRWLSDAVPRWRALADEVAKRLVALGVPPDGRVRSLAQDIPLNWVPEGWLPPDEARQLLEQRLHTLGEWFAGGDRKPPTPRARASWTPSAKLWRACHDTKRSKATEHAFCLLTWFHFQRWVGKD
jgi:DNA-binding ferritin-like protein